MYYLVEVVSNPKSGFLHWSTGMDKYKGEKFLIEKDLFDIAASSFDWDGIYVPPRYRVITYNVWAWGKDWFNVLKEDIVLTKVLEDIEDKVILYDESLIEKTIGDYFV